MGQFINHVEIFLISEIFFSSQSQPNLLIFQFKQEKKTPPQTSKPELEVLRFCANIDKELYVISDGRLKMMAVDPNSFSIDLL